MSQLSVTSLSPLSPGDPSPDDGGSRLLTAHCHPDCPNSGSNCSACSGEELLATKLSLKELRKPTDFRNLCFVFAQNPLDLRQLPFQTGQTIQLQGGQQVCFQLFMNEKQ